MISALSWIPRGAAKLKPELAELEGDGDHEVDSPSEEGDQVDVEEMSTSEDDETQEEIAQAKRFAALLKEQQQSEGGHAKIDDQGGISDSLAELNMDAYDDEDDDDDMKRILGGGHPGMAYYKNPEDDPYVDGVDSESEEMDFRDTDLLIAAARNEEDISYLEVWVYEEGDEKNSEGNIYVHHSLLLPAFPLCVAWGSCDPSSGNINGNFMAVGSFEPGIEIWNLDVIDAVEPVTTLGGANYEEARRLAEARLNGKKKKKKSKNKRAPEVPVKSGSHGDAVLGLAWNQEFCNVLASGSADKTIKVWDVVTQQASQTLSLHQDKVQAVKWRPTDASVLLSGGFDRNIFLTDLRQPGGGNKPLALTVGADVEALAWDPHDPHSFAVSAEDGSVAIFDERQGRDPIETILAHAKAATSISYSPCLKGVLVTGSTDATAKLWKGENGAHREVCCQKMGVGAIFSAEYCRDSPMLIAAGGANGTVTVWDTSVVEEIQ